MLGSEVFSCMRWLIVLLLCCQVTLERCSESSSCPSSTEEAEPSKPCVGVRCSSRTNRHSRSSSQHPTSSGSFQQPGRAHLLNPTREETVSTGQAVVDPWGGPQNSNGNASRDCKGIECKLPLRIRMKSRARTSCFGEGCPLVEGPLPTNPQGIVRLADRSAHFIGEVPDFQHGTSELGGAPLGVQLTCDIKPGENEVPSEDALILQLQLAKGQEKFVEALKSQQKTITDLQQKLSEQQVLLVNQQREIIEQQRKMYEQMDMIKIQYSILFDTVKQMSFQSLQEDIQNYFEAHLQGLQNQVRNHLQKTYSVQKVDVDSKIIDIEEPSLACADLCESDEFCNFQKTPPQCEKCTLCPAGFFQLSECSENVDRICQDRDECMDSPRICGEKIKCLNTPGGFRCLGVAEKDAALGLLKHNCRNFLQLSLKSNNSERLSHDGRSIKFTESGVVKFVFQQALYSMGPHCVREGVNYRDTSISASGAEKVSVGDIISFMVISPAQCNVRYFGENSGISN
ncbi:hypothetical protein GDO86_011910 [Hymenochirus boettgeri]|uniref:TNFR-Cys domain-containing protein n=1 Tax=Hymenochirus boettgeri TaxID=247094 RepID=A0A8T2JDC5_9PIPI|nr:hypothetical protein GDO86_011910 [Hymenochirus boettgeri]